MINAKVSRLAIVSAVIAWMTGIVYASPVDVPEPLWGTLSNAEKAKVLSTTEVNLISSAQSGLVIDVQTTNESTAPSNAGSQLGSAFGSAAYVDNAFKGNDINYSAKSYLGAAILGGVIGSTANTTGTSQFHTRYTVRTLTNEIKYVDDVSFSQFRHSVGLCVRLEPIRPTMQNLCSMTRESLLAIATGETKQNMTSNNSVLEAARPEPVVKCKVGGNGPTMLDMALCTQLIGTVIP